MTGDISRRDAIARVSVLLGGVALLGGEALLTPVSAAQRAAAAQGVGAFTAADVALLDEIAETILPQTSTPGAKAAVTGAFMALMVTDAYTPAQQAVFRDGMRQLNAAAVKEFGVPFVAASGAERLSLLQRLDRERQAEFDANEARLTPRAPAASSLPQVHYFRMMKELALLGFFTSEIGYRQVMRYVETPGRFDPCAPYAPDEKIWASHA